MGDWQRMRASQHPEAAFLAAMTASATHEVRNVLAIIKESAGLIEDIFQVSSKSGGPDKEKIYRSVHRIDTQVKRGADLLSNLNRLSHSLDQELATVDLKEEVELAVFLSQRFARKKGISVTVVEEAGGARATVHPLHLQMALFTAIERCIDELAEGASITVGLQDARGTPVVEVRGVQERGTGGSTPASQEAWVYLEGLVESLGATLERSEEDFGIRISFHPAKIS